MEDIIASSAEELREVLRSINITVPPRTEGRTSEDCERRSFCRFLSTLNGTGMVDYPLRVSKREKPDFQVYTGDSVWGVEVTEAIPSDYARASALRDRENPDALLDMSLFKYGETKTLEQIRGIFCRRKN